MSPVRILRHACAGFILALLLVAPALATAPATGKLQIIHLDVGQGDGAILITPGGTVAMFDDGPGGTGALGQTVLQQLQALGVTSIEHHFCSHYHSDHLGGTPSIVAGGITIANGWDRGGSYTTGAYTNYVTALGTHRKTIVKGQVITLDSLSAHPVYLKCIDLGGAGQSSTEENTLSLVMKVSYGEFDMTFGGDLPGQTTGSYKNIESTIGPEVGGHVEVYKVHHHGSATSSFDDWLNATTPTVAVISCGNGNSYGHPTAAALTRLHAHNVHTYWTETGSGVAPLAGWDKVSNAQIRIIATWEGAGVDTIRGNGFTDTFINSGSAPGDVTAPVVAMVSPDGGETWKAGSSHAITWTASDNVGVTTVDVAYSTNGGSSWTAIGSGLANSGSYAWTVPDAPGTTNRVRVVAHDAAGNLGADSSAANFTIDRWTIVASAGSGGSIAPSGSVAVAEGAAQSFTIAPAAHEHVADVLVDGTSVGAVTSYGFTGVAANHTIAASFALDTYTITASAGTGGTISPNGAVVVNWGDTPAFTITPGTGYAVADLLVDGTSVGPQTGYTFGAVSASHTLAASFTPVTFGLTVSVVGGGSVTKNPDLPSYPQYSSVQLTPVPGGGWAFAGWSGDTTGVIDPLTLVITGNRSVTAHFADVQAPAVTLLSPAGGEAWYGGETHSITWTAADNAGIDSVDVDYTADGLGGPWLAIAHGLTNSGSLPWLVPGSASDLALVRVTARDHAGNAASDSSHAVFSILSSTSGVVSGPLAYALAVPSPNPAPGSTWLGFSLARPGAVRLDVIDASGRRIASWSGDFGAGLHGVRWDGRLSDGSPAHSGLYLVRLQSAAGVRTRRLVLLH